MSRIFAHPTSSGEFQPFVSAQRPKADVSDGSSSPSSPQTSSSLHREAYRKDFANRSDGSLSPSLRSRSDRGSTEDSEGRAPAPSLSDEVRTQYEGEGSGQAGGDELPAPLQSAAFSVASPGSASEAAISTGASTSGVPVGGLATVYPKEADFNIAVKAAKAASQPALTSFIHKPSNAAYSQAELDAVQATTRTVVANANVGNSRWVDLSPEKREELVTDLVAAVPDAGAGVNNWRARRLLRRRFSAVHKSVKRKSNKAETKANRKA